MILKDILQRIFGQDPSQQSPTIQQSTSQEDEWDADKEWHDAGF